MGLAMSFMSSRLHNALWVYGRGWLCWALGVVPLSFAAGDIETNVVAPKFSRAQIDFYEKGIQPILAENCYKCHSHEAEKIKGSFVLDSRDSLLKGGETGP